MTRARRRPTVAARNPSPRKWLAALACLPAMVTCKPPALEEASVAAADLSEGIVARVGDQSITEESLRGVMSAQGLTAPEALDRLIQDALFAVEGERRYAGQAPARRAATATLARGVLERIWADVRSTQPTDDEVARKTEREWYDLDRPVSVRTIHAVVKSATLPPDPAAREVAERVLEAVRPTQTEEDFRKAAESVPAGDFTIKVETLPPVTADGRLVGPSWPPQRLVREYAVAANAIEDVGGLSGVVHTSYGYHVIRLLERTPGEHVGLEERRKRLRESIFEDRARKQVAQVLKRLRGELAIERKRAADTLMKRVRVGE